MYNTNTYVINNYHENDISYDIFIDRILNLCETKKGMLLKKQQNIIAAAH